MENVFLRDLMNPFFDEKIETKNLLLRLIIIIFIPVKYIIMCLIPITFFIWVFSGFGLLFVLDDFYDKTSDNIIGISITIVDLVILILVVLSKLFEK